MPFPSSSSPLFSWNQPHLKPISKEAAAADASGVLCSAAQSFFLPRFIWLITLSSKVSLYSLFVLLQFGCRCQSTNQAACLHTKNAFKDFDFSRWNSKGFRRLQQGPSYDFCWQVVVNSFAGMTKIRCEWHQQFKKINAIHTIIMSPARFHKREQLSHQQQRCNRKLKNRFVVNEKHLVAVTGRSAAARSQEVGRSEKTKFLTTRTFSDFKN